MQVNLFSFLWLTWKALLNLYTNSLLQVTTSTILQVNQINLSSLISAQKKLVSCHHTTSCLLFFSALDTNNISTKKQVIELLSALFVYSSEGYARAIGALEQYKVCLPKNSKLSPAGHARPVTVQPHQPEVWWSIYCHSPLRNFSIEVSLSNIESKLT